MFKPMFNYMFKLNNHHPGLLLFGVLLFLSYVIPFHYHPFRDFFHDAAVIMSVVLGLSYVGLCKEQALRIPHAVLVPCALMVVIGMQALLGLLLFPIDSLFPIIYLLALGVAMIFGATAAARPEGLTQLSKTMALVFVGVGVVSVIFQLTQLLGLDCSPLVMAVNTQTILRPFANLAQPNLMALVFCFGLASVWWLYLSRALKPWVGVVLLLVLLWGIALTQSRIAWLILPLFLVLCWRSPPDTARVSKWVLIIGALIFIAMVLALPAIFSMLGIVIESPEQHASQTAVRLVLWQQAWMISTQHVLFGAGWNQFGPQQVMLATLFNPAEYSNHAHNLILNFAAEIGWPITLLLIFAGLVWAYFCCFKRWQNLPVRFFSLLLLAIVVHSMVEYPLWFGIVLIPFGVMVGALHVERLGWVDAVLHRYWFAVLGLCSTLILGGIVWDYSRVMTGFVALVWQQEGKTSGVGSTVKPPVTLFPQFYDYFRMAKVNVYVGMPQPEISFLEKTSLEFAFPPLLTRTAMAYAYNQRPMEALQVLITIQRLHPSQYANTYAIWQGFASKDPVHFAQIVQGLPLPANVVGSNSTKIK